MAEHKREPQRVDIYRTRPIERDPLPTAEEIAEKLDRHPQAVKIREGRFSDWIGKPLSDGIWTAWGLKARVDERGLTWSAVNEVSHIGDPPEVGEPHLTQVRYVKSYPLLPEDLREKMSPKWGGHRELEYKYEVWSDETPALVEEALSRRWYAGRDIPWKEMTPLPDDLERAFDQFLTYLIQCQFLCSDVIGPTSADQLRLPRSEEHPRLRDVRLQRPRRDASQAGDPRTAAASAPTWTASTRASSRSATRRQTASRARSSAT